MNDSERLILQCPCCDARLVVDRATGEVLSHRQSKGRPAGSQSLESLFAHLDEQKEQRESVFDQEVAALKDKDRILEEKFEEALRRAKEEDDDEPPMRPWDLD